MLEQSRPGEHSVLGHMPHQDERHAQTTADLLQGGGNGAHLAHIAGEAIGFQAGQGLDGIHNGKAGPLACGRAFQRGRDILHARCCHSHEPRVQQAKALAARLDLRQGFLAAGIEDGAPLRRHRGRHLKQQGGFADAGFAAHKDGRAGHQPLAQHPVQGAKPAGEWVVVAIGHITEDPGTRALPDIRVTGGACPAGSGLRLGHKRVPCLTPGALAAPVRTLRAALRAAIGLSQFCHAEI